ncbi:MAG: hypothetical protein HY900_23580 [Deltaproteobacteria bacterium]|nr:hypothetical protein [Deltaproteobacteria bacterium]
MVTTSWLQACEPALHSSARPLGELTRNGGRGARLSLFLALKESGGPSLRLEVASVELFSESGWLPVRSGGLRLDSQGIGPKQVFLGSRAVPPGHYQRVRLTLEEGSVRREDGSYGELPVDPGVLELELPSPLLLAQDDSRSLFFTWDVYASLPTSDRLQPSLAVAPQIKPLLVDLVYAACPDANTIFVIRTDKHWVADSFPLTGRPTDLAMDPNPSRRRLYVLASREPAVKVVDLSSQRVIAVYGVPLAATLTSMTISPDGKFAYVLDESGGYVMQVDLATGRSTARARLAYRPRYVAYLAEQNLLAVSAAVSQTVLLLNPLDLSEVGRVVTGDGPQGLLLSKSQLYIAEAGDDTVSVYDFATNRIQARLSVGGEPRRLLDDGNHIYVSNQGSGSLSVLVPGQIGVARTIRIGGRPTEMALDTRERWLYVADDQEAALAVVDTTANQFAGRVDLGARPQGLAVIR